MKTLFSDNVIEFNRQLVYPNKLPHGFDVINPYQDNPETLEVMKQFYSKYYGDANHRKLILGINPGRYGAAVTGVPFTDTKHLERVCGITMHTAYTHEPSAVFVHEMIHAYGGVAKFFGEFYINSLFPLAIIREKEKGKWVNANYYDDPAIYPLIEDFIVASLEKQIGFGLDTTEVFILGKKNAGYVERLNKKTGLFKKMTILEHPRYIQQYKSKEKQQYIDKYIMTLNGLKEDGHPG